LRFLYVGANQLIGDFLSEIGLLTKLEQLFLEGNYFGPTVPAEFAGLSSLTILDLQGNKNLSGTIPSFLFSMTQLHALYLNDNSFSGNVPADLGNLNRLQILRLQGNQLTGPLPSELGKLTILGDLNLANNELNGTIPTEHSPLAELFHFQIEDNFITGNLDAIFCQDDRDFPFTGLSADCLEESPEVQCSCCLLCCSEVDGCQTRGG